LREATYGIFSSLARERPPREEDLEILNRELRESLMHQRVEPSAEGFGWTFEAAEDALDQMLWPLARSAADLLVSDEADRVRECAAPSCSWLFLDRSRNHRRKWCDMAVCGNRAKARRHYRRHRTSGAPAEPNG
jgi:predicted RNA-binding Zn ribbon-like protein